MLLVWHARSLYAELQVKKGYNKHLAVYKHFGMTVRDFPFIVGTLVAGICVWRLPSIYQEFNKVSP